MDSSIIPGKYLLFMGRLSHRKGVDTLLSALSKMPGAGCVELVIAGSGDERLGLQQMIVDLQLESRVRMVGRVEGDMKIYLLQNAECVVVPSRGWEAFPLVVLEAYAAGRAVVGSRIAGLEDVVTDGETGLLVEAESIEGWATALGKVRSGPAWILRAGETARGLAQDFGWDRIAGKHLDLYHQWVGK